MRQKIVAWFTKKELYPQVLRAYFHKMPERIRVSWEKHDNGFIVATIQTDRGEFYTQGRNPKELIEMVNDAIFTAYDVKEEYRPELSKHKFFKPTAEEWSHLNDAATKEHAMQLERQLA